MSKRNKKQVMYQPNAPAKRRTTGTRPSSRQTRGSGGGNRSAARPYSRPAQPAPRVSTRTSLLTVRIAAIVIAAAAITGGSAWALSIQNSQAGYGSGQIAGLILLGFLAGLGIALAIRTEEIMVRVSKLMRARR